MAYSSHKKAQGVAFSDFLSQGLGRSSKHNFDLKTFSSRNSLIIIALSVFTILLLSRTVFLQFVKGSYYRNLSDSNRIKTEFIHAPRGIIFDREGEPLVFNSPGFRITQDGKIVLLEKDKALPLIAQNVEGVEVDSFRNYPHKEEFSHVLGYLGQISEEELKLQQFREYEGGELIGKMGIEREYEGLLRGVKGKKLVEVDSTGKAIRTLGESEAIAGNDVILTLSGKLQKAAYEAMKDVEKGALVATNTKGEVLTLISKPSFDPNLFTLPQNYKAATDSSYLSIDDILSDNQNQPLLNRAISGTYPPGSTFKLVTAAAGLESGAFDQNFKVQDEGILRVGEFSFANWFFTQYGRTDGTLDVEKAIMRSNDIFFYRAAEKVGVERLSEWARKFGLGEKLGIDLGGSEAEGLVPSPSWKEEAVGEPWYLGDTFIYGIGQGYLLTTPLQVNTWTQILASGGDFFEPHLLKTKNPEPKNENILSKDTIGTIKKGMVESCSPGGVAWPLFDFKVDSQKLKGRIDGKNFIEVDASSSAGMKNPVKVSVACKTGTAEQGGEKDDPHAWITLFAPAENPEIVLTVLSEASGEGSNVAAPIAKKVLEAHFRE